MRLQRHLLVLNAGLLFVDVVNLHLQVYVHVVLVDVARSTSGLLDAAAKRAGIHQMDATSVGSEMLPPLMPPKKIPKKRRVWKKICPILPTLFNCYEPSMHDYANLLEWVAAKKICANWRWSKRVELAWVLYILTQWNSKVRKVCTIVSLQFD